MQWKNVCVCVCVCYILVAVPDVTDKVTVMSSCRMLDSGMTSISIGSLTSTLVFATSASLASLPGKGSRNLS